MEQDIPKILDERCKSHFLAIPTKNLDYFLAVSDCGYNNPLLLLLFFNLAIIHM